MNNNFVLNCNETIDTRVFTAHLSFSGEWFIIIFIQKNRILLRFEIIIIYYEREKKTETCIAVEKINIKIMHERILSAIKFKMIYFDNYNKL